MAQRDQRASDGRGKQQTQKAQSGDQQRRRQRVGQFHTHSVCTQASTRTRRRITARAIGGSAARARAGCDTTQVVRAVTVYCSSSSALEPHYVEMARAMGHGLAERGLELVYGGGTVGLMGEMARACKERGGHVTGIITHKLCSLEQQWTGCDELQAVDTMQQRRRLLMDRGDGYVMLPGGLGTYEEFFEVLVARQLGDHHKPIAIVNHEGYYDPLLAMIDHGVEHRFVRPAIRRVLTVAPTPHVALDALQAHETAPYNAAEFLPMGARREGPPA